MKRILQLAILPLILVFTQPVSAQDGFYTTSGGEMIFSFAQVQENGVSLENRMRWSPVFNFGTYMHYDFGASAGFMSGIDVKNIGFIYQDAANLKVIHRTYNLGIPVAFKLGNLKEFFLYGGYQIEFPFHYKRKSWDSSDRSGAKTKITGFFSDATPRVMHTVFGGVQFYRGLNLKFRWYLNNFLNPDYNRNGVLLNQGLEVQVFSFSLAASMFRGSRFYYSD